MPQLTGKIIANRFEVWNTLGRGGFGTVYSGYDTIAQREVAIKTQSDSAFGRESFTIEVKLYKLLNCNRTGFPILYWAGMVGNRKALVMERLGANMSDPCIRREPVLLKDVCMLATRMLDRLEVLHNLGYIHNDVKPDNILAGVGQNSGLIYLCDFGKCLQYISGGKPTHTRTAGGTWLFGSIGMHSRAVASPRRRWGTR